MSRLSRLLAAVVGVLLLTAPSFGDSQARVVRLSDVQGDVQIDRNAGQGFEKAFLNLPVTQGVKLKVGNDGRAAVEFEDGSTLRLTPNTVIDFPQLSLRDSGTKATVLHLQEGTAYVNFVGAKDQDFMMTFAHEKISLSQSAHVRIEMADTMAIVAVISGDVRVEGDAGTVSVSKNQTASFDLSNGDQSKLVKDIEPGPYDAWDKQQDQYQKQYAKAGSYSSYSPYAYGSTDLNYYGSFINAPGYGTLWQPYFAGAGWDPFMNGAWAFYPGFGYSWVSGYPWGWVPYHYGSWTYLPAYGWAWQPGGTWTGLSQPRFVNPPSNFLLPKPPSSTGQGTIMVNRGGPPIQPGKSNRLNISNNSAGLGIPRGGVKNLGELSHTVQQRGFAEAKVQTAPVGVSPWSRGYSAPHSGAVGGGRAPSAPAGRSVSSHASVGHASVRR